MAHGASCCVKFKHGDHGATFGMPCFQKLILSCLSVPLISGRNNTGDQSSQTESIISSLYVGNKCKIVHKKCVKNLLHNEIFKLLSPETPLSRICIIRALHMLFI
jgi:hypothetical protein